MAYNGKFISYVGIIESVFRDSGLDFVDFEAATEWTAELIGIIGVPQTMVDKVTDGIDGNPSGLKVENYRCKLPDDLEKLVSIRKVDVDDSGMIYNYSEMVESPDIFHPSMVDQYENNRSSNWNPLVNIDEFNPADETFSPDRVQYELDAPSLSSGVPYSYKIDHGYIFTNFESGYVQVSYKGFPIDANGFPLVPDDPKFKEALKYHLIYKIDWRNWRINPSPQNKAILNDSERQRNFYISSARNKAHIPSYDKMEQIKNMWLRSIPKINEHSNGFKTTSAQEVRYNQSRKNRRYR